MTLQMTSSVLENKKLMKELREMKFDIAIIDGIDFSSCLYIIGHNLGVRTLFKN